MVRDVDGMEEDRFGTVSVFTRNHRIMHSNGPRSDIPRQMPVLRHSAAVASQLGTVVIPALLAAGATLLSAELVAKRLGILRDLLPSVKKIAMLVNPTRPGVDTQKVQVQGAAQALGLSLHILQASSERDFDAVFRAVLREQDGALVVA